MFSSVGNATRLRCGLMAATCGAMALAAAASPVAAGRLITFTASDDTPLVGMLYEASSRPAPAVVLVHMLGRSKEEWSLLAERLQDAGLTSLAIDLRGHGRSGGSAADLPGMINDVRGAVAWLAGSPGVRAGAIALVGASLGANVAGAAMADLPQVRAAALISPSLDYRGLRLDSTTVRKIGDRPLWLAASSDDPYALRTVNELTADAAGREQRLSSIRGHGTMLLNADQDLGRALVDWLRRTLIF